ncbi:response regulator [Lichenifustis flavocetrariae]|uniref:Response regulator n=1 Tax=Lichenifustis flavocetrariae TaxID=2949735 RepID=A0AA41Z3V7_9HYPH|nr:response regulator [Lichenifustis flavocetrariae]MCW6512448.1 response regulator [Lichenifustis flavocetrariae]
MVVEDEPVIRMIAVEMLEDAGWSVVEFATADDAIAFCRRPENDFAAVITDINMPGDMDGLDLASLVVSSRPDAFVVVTSGRYQERPADLAERVRFLPKPWKAGDLLAAVTGVSGPGSR